MIGVYMLGASAAYLVFAVTALRRIGFFNPAGLFGTAHLLMTIGTLLRVDSANPIDVEYAAIMAYSSIAISAVLTITLGSLKRERLDGVVVLSTFPTSMQWIVAIVSSVLVLGYFQAVGYSAFLEGLRGLTSESEVDVATLRLESYSGSSYFAPGYVAQFKNAILPALVVVAWLSGAHRKRGVLRLLLIGLTVVAIFGLIGTGQRQALVLAVLAALCFIYQYREGRGIRVGRILVFAGGALVLLILVTSVLNRTDDLQQASTWFGRSQVALTDLFDRVMFINQVAGIEGYRYTSGMETDFPGAEWLEGIRGLAPGYSGSTLASEIFAARFGTDRGTSPPSLWGSVNYNFGAAGTIVAPIVFSLVIARLTRPFVTGSVRSLMQAAGMAGVAAVLGFWVAGSPVTLLNNGLPGYIVLWIWGASQTKRLADDRAAAESSQFKEGGSGAVPRS